MKLDSRPQSKPKDIDLTAFAFYQGAQGISLDETRREIQATHDKEQAKLEEESVRREKPLEATIQKLERLRPQVDAAWDDMLRRVGHHTPSIAAAVLIAFLGVGALVIDAVLLGPGFDAVGVSDPAVQLIAAFGLAALSSAIFHFAYETIEHNRLTLDTRIIRRVIAGIAVVALLSWGILRGLEVKFASDLNQNPLGNFLGEHPVLSSIFFCFVTLAAPLVGAAALHHTAPLIHEWLSWRRAKQAHEKLHTALGDAQKKLESERATLQHQLCQLNAQQGNWQALAAQYHERGRIRGARQTPHWLVLLKASAWSLVGLVLGCILGTFLAPLYFALPVGTWIAAFLYYRHRRFHPTYDQFKRQENTRFAVGTDRPQIEFPLTPRLLPPPEDKR